MVMVYLTSALKVVQEVVQTLTGHELVHQGNSVAYRQEHGVETLQWLLTKTVSQVTGIANAARLLLQNVHQELRS